MTTKNTIEFTYTDDDGDDVTIDIPAQWCICGTCRGNGSHSLAVDGHGITESEREQDWSHDEWEDYMDGGYDSTCDVCAGSGKVLEPVLDSLSKEDRDRYTRSIEDDASYSALCRMERMMGA